jgi:uncharacterized protein YecE (DUF72 family)
MSLSPLIRFGTSTWTYEGWRGQVYNKLYPKSRFKQDCLAEYAAYQYKGEPLFRTVGIDHSFYGPPSAKLLEHYASQLPAGFTACAKVWKDITVPAYSNGLRYARKSGLNDHFLDACYFEDHVLAPFDQAFQGHTGPFIFEFQRTGITPTEFLAKLDEFLGHLPARYEYAVEVRNPALLGSEYQSILTSHQVSHVYNYLYAMPSLEEQHAAVGSTFTAPFVLFRLLTPRDKKYHDAVKAYQPYDKLVHALPDMRAHTAQLIKAAVGHNRRAYVLVNNRSEGNAPLTVQALADLLEDSYRGGMSGAAAMCSS